jgi:hypothetical protein
MMENPFEAIASRLDAIDRRLDRISALETLSVRDLAEKFGCCARSLTGNPWRLPNYGNPDIAPRRWLRKTIDSWYAVPEAERRERWDAMTSAERLKARGRG